MNVLGQSNNILNTQLKANNLKSSRDVVGQSKPLNTNNKKDSENFSNKLERANQSHDSKKQLAQKRDDKSNKYSEPSEKKSHSKHNENRNEKAHASNAGEAKKPNENRKILPHENRSGQSSTNHYSEVRQETLEKTSPYKNISDLNEKLETLGLTSEEFVDPLTRRAAIQKFMKKMNDEFNVTPVDLVNAFSKLSVEELGMPADQTAHRVISQLNMNPADMPQAHKHFQTMLTQTEASSMAEYLKGAGTRQISLEVLSKEQLQKSEMTDSVKNMQNKFFQSSSLSGAKQALAQENANKVADTNMMTGMAAGAGLGELFQEPVAIEAMAAAKQAPATKTFDDLIGQLNLKMGELSQSVNNMNKANTVNVQTASTQEAGVASLASAGLGAQGSEENLSEDGSEMGSDSQLGDDGFSALVQDSKSKPMAKTVQVGTEQVEVTEADESKNSQQILKSAQRLIKDGGGEMKVRLNPHGLGEMSLKVSVENGQVNIDMLTDNNQLKKLVEKGLGDLKTTLATHNFDVQQIKVDVSQDLQSNLNQDNQEQQQLAEQFLQDFRRQNQSFREFVSGGVSGLPESQTSADRRLEAEQAIQAQRKADSNRRLDLVA